jgi:hypothetical protein
LNKVGRPPAGFFLPQRIVGIDRLSDLESRRRVNATINVEVDKLHRVNRTIRNGHGAVFRVAGFAEAPILN